MLRLRCRTSSGSSNQHCLGFGPSPGSGSRLFLSQNTELPSPGPACCGCFLSVSPTLSPILVQARALLCFSSPSIPGTDFSFLLFIFWSRIKFFSRAPLCLRKPRRRHKLTREFSPLASHHNSPQPEAPHLSLVEFASRTTQAPHFSQQPSASRPVSVYQKDSEPEGSKKKKKLPPPWPCPESLR